MPPSIRPATAATIRAAFLDRTQRARVPRRHSVRKIGIHLPKKVENSIGASVNSYLSDGKRGKKQGEIFQKNHRAFALFVVLFTTSPVLILFNECDGGLRKARSDWPSSDFVVR